MNLLRKGDEVLIKATVARDQQSIDRPFEVNSTNGSNTIFVDPKALDRVIKKDFRIGDYVSGDRFTISTTNDVRETKFRRVTGTIIAINDGVFWIKCHKDYFTINRIGANLMEPPVAETALEARPTCPFPPVEVPGNEGYFTQECADGKFLLIHSRHVIGQYPTLQDAYNAVPETAIGKLERWRMDLPYYINHLSSGRVAIYSNTTEIHTAENYEKAIK